MVRTIDKAGGDVLIIVYASRTHNVERFCKKITQYQSVRVEDYTTDMGNFILITYTDNFGEVPTEVKDFLESHSDNMVGVCASGKQSWKLFGTYCKSADLISEQYQVPIFHKFEMQGNQNDIDIVVERIENFEQEKLH